MGIWAEIKHALNSSIGTAEFMPLDKLIKGQRTWVASDSVIKVLRSRLNDLSNEVNVGTFTPKTTGSVRVSATLDTTRGGTTVNSCSLEVYKGDSMIASVSSNAEMGIGDKISVDISLQAGVTYTVYGTTGYRENLVNVAVCGSIIDTSLME